MLRNRIIENKKRTELKTGFLKKESPSRFFILILNGAQNFKFIGFLYATLIGWIFYTFQDTITS